MARTITKIKCADIQSAKSKIERILYSHDYKPVFEKGEDVWRCGIGMITAIKYIKLEFSESGNITISGWIRTAVIGPEQDLNGVVAIIPKKQVLGVIKEIQSAIL